MPKSELHTGHVTETPHSVGNRRCTAAMLQLAGIPARAEGAAVGVRGGLGLGLGLGLLCVCVCECVFDCSGKRHEHQV